MTPEGSKKANFTSKYLSPCRTIGLKRKSKSPGSLLNFKRLNTPYSENAQSEINLMQNNETIEQTCSLNSEDLLNRNVESPNRNDILSTISTTPKYTSKRFKLPNRTCNLDTSKSEEQSNISNEVPIKDDVNLKTPSTPVKQACVTSVNTIISTPKNMFMKNSIMKMNESPLNKSKMKTEHCDSNLLASKVPKNIMEKILQINEKYEKLQHLQNNKIYTDKHNLAELKESTERWKKVCIEALERLHSEIRLRGDTTTSLGDLIKAHSIPPDLLSFDMDLQEFT